MEEVIFRDKTRSIDARVGDLIGRMTIDEKIRQLLHDAPPIDRLEIPAYNWWNECLHGVARAGKATVFPQVIGLAAAFDADLVRRIASAISDEGRAKFHAAVRAGNRGRYRGLTFWSPNVNIFRDPRWGRGQETYGEDPYLTAVLAVQFINGIQGEDPVYLKAAACAKHFAVHSGPEKERHSFNASVTPKDLYETYLPAFKACVEAGVEAVMGAYNRVNGEACCASSLLLGHILRGLWKFNGHVVSDCWAVRDFHDGHKITKSPEESAALALNTGCDLNCGCTYKALLKAYDDGLVDDETIDRSVTRVMTTRFKLGLFDRDEDVPFASLPPDIIDSDFHRRLAREAAVKSMVLLKNDNNTLPLKGVRKILVTGPQAAAADVLLGNYHGLNGNLVSFIEGLTQNADEGVNIEYRPGYFPGVRHIDPSNWVFSEAADADVAIAVLGLTPSYEGEEGEAVMSQDHGDRLDLELPPEQVLFLRHLRQRAKRLVLVLTGGSPIAFDPALADAVIFTWYPGEEGGSALADILTGLKSPSGKLPVTFPYNTAQLPPFTDYSMIGRTYRFMEKEPLYPFGFGLGYTHFTYERIKLSSDRLVPGECITVTATVANRGDSAGEEVAQLYIKDTESSVRVPRWSLRGFRRISLNPGESRSVIYPVSIDDLVVIDNDGNTLIEPGEYVVCVGGASPGERSAHLGAPVPATARLYLDPAS